MHRVQKVSYNPDLPSRTRHYWLIMAFSSEADPTHTHTGTQVTFTIIQTGNAYRLSITRYWIYLRANRTWLSVRIEIMKIQGTSKNPRRLME